MSDVPRIVRKQVTNDGKSAVVTERELTQTEVNSMDSAIEKVLDDVHHGRAEKNAARPADPYEIAQYEADVLQGRDQDKEGYWRQVMEHHGFNWLEPADLEATIGPERFIPSTIVGKNGEQIHDRYGREIYNNRLYWTRSHTVGQWRPDIGSRRPHPALTGSFTMKDLVGMYGDPEAFDEWAKLMIRRWERHRKHLKVRRR